MATIKDYENLARKAHDGQFRMDGITPYIEHPSKVAQIVNKITLFDGVNNLTYSPTICIENLLKAAFIHDVVEDTDYTIDMIRSELKLDELDVTLIITDLITHKKDESYLDYIIRIKRFRDLVLIKQADMISNYQDLDNIPRVMVDIAHQTNKGAIKGLTNKIQMGYYILTGRKIEDDIENYGVKL